MDDMDSSMENVERMEPTTYSVHVVCSNCGFDSEDELFLIEQGTKVEWADCPICGCKCLGRYLNPSS